MTLYASDRHPPMTPHQMCVMRLLSQAGMAAPVTLAQEHPRPLPRMHPDALVYERDPQLLK